MTAPLSQETIDALVQMYHQGRTYDEICETLEIGRTTLKRYIQKSGLSHRQTPIVFTEAKRAEFIAAYADPDLTIPQICDRFGMSPCSVERYRHLFGCPARGKGFQKFRSVLSSETLESVRHLYSQTTLSQDAIAERLGLPMSRLRWAIEQLQLEGRPRAHSPLKLSEHQLAEFRTLYLDPDYTIRAICEHFEISETAVSHYREVLGLAKRGPGKRTFSEAELQDMQERYELGLSLSRLCDDFRTNKARIHKEMQQRGVPLRSDRNPERRLTPKERQDLMYLYFNSDMSIAAICELFEIRSSTLYRELDWRQAGRRTGPATGAATALCEAAYARIRAMYRDPHYTTTAICEAVGISEFTLFRSLALLGETRRMEPSKCRASDTEFLRQFQERYMDLSVSVREIQDQLGLTKKSLNVLVRQLGLPPRSPQNRTDRRSQST